MTSFKFYPRIESMPEVSSPFLFLALFSAGKMAAATFLYISSIIPGF